MSEQRRPLLLPQEVKALGTGKALIFYEGLAPIRCRKIRYFEDARFRARLVPPPVVAPIAIETGAPSGAGDPAAMPAANGEIDATGTAGAAGTTAAGATPVYREATMEDIDRLDSLTLEDFEAPLGEIELPAKAPGERLTAEEMNAAVAKFLQSLER